MLNRQFRLLACVAFAVAALGAAASTASASRGASITNGVTLISANGTLTVTSGFNVICAFTVGFGLNSSVAKSVGAAVGTVLPAPASQVSNCSLGVTGTILSGATIRYANFTGQLPALTGLGAAIVGFGFALNIPSIGTCLWNGTLNVMLSRNLGTGAIDTISLPGSPLPLSTGIASCPMSATLRGSLTVLPTKPIYQLI
jgi:hypothetical protein